MSPHVPPPRRFATALARWDAEVERRRAIWCSSTGRLPEMTFSLNQRMAAARARRPRR